MRREGGDFAEVSAFTEERDRQDSERYMRIYQINNNHFEFADLIIDTDNKSPEEIAGLIVAEARKKLF